MNENHEVERFENLMYKGCEPHWHCIYCDGYWPFHCYGKKDLEQMECPARKWVDKVKMLKPVPKMCITCQHYDFGTGNCTVRNMYIGYMNCDIPNNKCKTYSLSKNYRKAGNFMRAGW